MTDQDYNQQTSDKNFASQAEGRSRGVFGEFAGFMVHNKKWWLLPTIIFLLAAGALVMISGTSFAPLIYTLF